MSDIKEKFGTGWIGTGTGGATEDEPPRSSRRNEVDDPSHSGDRGQGFGFATGRGDKPAFVTLSKQMIRLLRETGEVDRLYNLADKMKLGPDDLEPVVEWLAKNYYIRVEPDTKFGNHEIRLTGRASDLA